MTRHKRISTGKSISITLVGRKGWKDGIINVGKPLYSSILKDLQLEE